MRQCARSGNSRPQNDTSPSKTTVTQTPAASSETMAPAASSETRVTQTPAPPSETRVTQTPAPPSETRVTQTPVAPSATRITQTPAPSNAAGGGQTSTRSSAYLVSADLRSNCGGRGLYLVKPRDRTAYNVVCQGTRPYCESNYGGGRYVEENGDKFCVTP